MKSTEYLAGFGDGAAKEAELNEIDTFAAIRRAAAVAREWDSRSLEEWTSMVNADNPLAYREHAINSDAMLKVANDIRRAIRAAIGSEKT